MTQNISSRDYGSRVALLAETQRERLIKALLDEKTLKLLRRSCKREQPIRIEITTIGFQCPLWPISMHSERSWA